MCSRRVSLVRTGMFLLMVGVLFISEGWAQQAGWRASHPTVSADADPSAPPALPPLPSDATALPAPKPTPLSPSSQTEKQENRADSPVKSTPEAPSAASEGAKQTPSTKQGGPSATPGAPAAPGGALGSPHLGGSALSILDMPSAEGAPFCPVSSVCGKPSCCTPVDVPFMFGDSLSVPGQVFAGTTFLPGITPYSDLPLAGGSRRVKIAENNRLMPTDRIYFQYNHFHNAFEWQSPAGGDGVGSLDQYTLGIEKTFLDGRWSLEVRMPFTGAYRAEMPGTDLTPGLSLSTSHYGNLAVILKRLLWSGSWWALGGGLGVDIPLGSDVQGNLAGIPFAIDNEAVHLLPFGGAVIQPTDRLFGQAFLQVDVPLNGNRVVLDTTPIGDLTEQLFMYIDAAIGYWVYRNPQATWLTGLAGLIEVHYTTTLQDADVFSGSVGGGTLGVGNVWNRMDVVNLTIGLHAEFGLGCTLGVGGVVPLDDRPDRLFDAEIQVFLNYRY